MSTFPETLEEKRAHEIARCSTGKMVTRFVLNCEAAGCPTSTLAEYEDKLTAVACPRCGHSMYVCKHHCQPVWETAVLSGAPEEVAKLCVGCSAAAAAAVVAPAPQRVEVKVATAAGGGGTESLPGDVRVAVVGNVDSGKSTLIGVLTGGKLDNGRGEARSRVFVHAHERQNGRTSYVGHHLMGFDAAGSAVHQRAGARVSSAVKTASWRDVVRQSASLVTFLDMAGHEQYLRTTAAGLTGGFPDYALVVVNSGAGVTEMTRKHMALCLALNIPMACVVTKVDHCPTSILKRTKQGLSDTLKKQAGGAARRAYHVSEAKHVTTAVSYSASGALLVPIFYVSCVNGYNLDLLRAYLRGLPARREWCRPTSLPPAAPQSRAAGDSGAEFDVEEAFQVVGMGVVLSGTVTAGRVRREQVLLLGPFDARGEFRRVRVREVHRSRVRVQEALAGQGCSLAVVSAEPKWILSRTECLRGRSLVDPALQPRAAHRFLAEITVSHHHTTIKANYQAVLHCRTIRQTVVLEQGAESEGPLRSGDVAVRRFRFLLRPEYLHPGDTFIFREGELRGAGRVLRVLHDSGDEGGTATATGTGTGTEIRTEAGNNDPV